MEIKVLVYVGVFLVILGIIFEYYFMNSGIRKMEKKMDMDSKNFEVDKKLELENVDKKIEAEIKTPTNTLKLQEELDTLNKELKMLETDMSKIDNSKIGLSTETITPVIEVNKEVVTTETTQTVTTVPVVEDNKSEVFHIMNNIFNADDSKKVCRALFNSDLADDEQLAQSDKANWCNYGWAKDGKMYYVLDSDTNNDVCSGKKGINGGKPNNTNIKLGVNCYGVKPSKHSKIDTLHNKSEFTNKELEMLERYRQQYNSGDIKLAPYNPNEWSRYSYKHDQIKLGDKNIITTVKTDKSNDPKSIKTEKVLIDNIITINQ
jgi:hypothetical protein